MLNDWTFAVTVYDPNQDSNVPVENATLSIFEGNGNGGTLVGSSTTSTVTTIVATSGDLTATQWTFADGGLSLIDNQRYTAVLVGSGNFLFIFDASDANPYANGFATLGTSGAYGGDLDAVFSANFSEANPVPEPLTLLGASAAIAFGAGFKRRSNKTTEQK